MQQQCLEEHVTDIRKVYYDPQCDFNSRKCVIKAEVKSENGVCVGESSNCVPQESKDRNNGSFSEDQGSNDGMQQQCDENSEIQVAVPIEGNIACSPTEDKFKCAQCSYLGCSAYDVKVHVKIKHIKEKKHKCDICNSCYISSTSLKRHQVTHLPEKPFVCEHCQKRFNLGYYLKRHLLTHKEKEKRFQCNICSYRTAYNCNLQYHVVRDHTVDKSFVCDVCDYKFITADELRKHIPTHSPLNFSEPDENDAPKKSKRGRHKESATKNDDNKPYKCYDCPFQCLSLDLLIQHIDSNCTPKPSIKEKVAISKETVADSQEMPVDDSTKPYVCESCDYATSNNSHLRRHVLSQHTSEKPFQCTTCDYKCVTAADLKRHIASKHTKEKSYPCPTCDYKCAAAADLKRHITRKHTSEKSYPCPTCDFKCATLADLRQHRFTHSADKFKCDDCDYRCKRADQLKSHVARYHK